MTSRNLALGAVFFVLGLFAGYQAMLWYVPWALMQKTYERFSPANQWFHAPVEAGTKASWVPLGNPDIVASRASYDLTNGPLKLTGQAPVEGYWSLTIFDGRSINFFVLNNDQLRGRPFSVTLVKEGASIPAGPQTAVSPSTKGYVIIRTFVDARTDLRALDAMRQSFVIEPDRSDTPTNGPG